MKVQPPPPPTVTEVALEAIPSTDELSALFEKRYADRGEADGLLRVVTFSSRMLLTERSKYNEIHEKMKKKKLENGLLARDIERLEEQLAKKRTQVKKNDLLLQHWQKQVWLPSSLALNTLLD